tara:strand:- start:1504 stop:2181 length:678 start_codon:yes stop_codon:yes gene_type:complete
MIKYLKKILKINKKKKTSSYIRYDYLIEYIKKKQCKNILEIGTWNGNNTLKMLNAASTSTNQNKEIKYWGFDLWELMNDEIFKKEYSKKPPSMESVKNKLDKTGCEINLYQGDTKHTLKDFNKLFKNKIKLDFIYIDGGHSFDTISSDWNYIKDFINENTIVIFDDYYIYTKPDITTGVGSDLKPTFGCNETINKLDKTKWNVEILPNYDQFGPRKVFFVLVTKK